MNMKSKRRIERNSGSKYYINSIEKRAKDVQLFFADNSLVRIQYQLLSRVKLTKLLSQNQMSEEKILEEAAGISGLHHRKRSNTKA